jgi:hypothetical protein
MRVLALLTPDGVPHQNRAWGANDGGRLLGPSAQLKLKFPPNKT